jgi:hypothetical protein
MELAQVFRLALARDSVRATKFLISTRVNKPENDDPSILDPITTLVA